MRLRILPAGYILLVGDLVAFLLFAYYGKLAHHLPVTFVGLLETLAPFLLGWIIAIIRFRSYSVRAYETAGRLLLSTLLTWTVAASIGLMLRSWWTGVQITLVFASVAYFITLAFILGWRIPFAIIFAIKKRSSRTAL